MNSTERILASIGFHRVDRPPVAPELIAVTATICGVPVSDYVQNGDVIARCQIDVANKTGTDALFAAADLCVEAEALGCPIHFPQDNYPHIVSPILKTHEDLKKLSIPDPSSDGRMPQILKAARLLSADAEGRLVLGNAVGPITLASRIMDIEKMLYMIVDEPAKFRDILDFCTQVSIRFVEAIIDAGAGGILLFDPSASPALLPRRIFREFELGPIRQILAAAKEKNPSVVTWYSVAGPAQTNTDLMSAVAADVTTVDYTVPLSTAMEFSGHTVINGNIKPTLFLEGTEKQIYDEAIKLLDQTRLQERFILGSGCEIPLNSPVENIMALRRAVDDHAARIIEVNEPAQGATCVVFLPHNRRVHVPAGETILEAAAQGGAPITTYCDLSGVCAECVVEVTKGVATTPDMLEETQLVGMTQRGARLACLARIQGDMEVYVPFSSRRLPDRVCAPVQLLAPYDGFDPDSDDFAPPFSPLQEKDPIPFPTQDRRPVAPLHPERGNFCQSPPTLQTRERRPWFAVAVDLSGENVAACVHDITSGRLFHAGVFQGPLAALGLSAMDGPSPVLSDRRLVRSLQEETTRLFNSIINWIYEAHSVMPERVRGILATGHSVTDTVLRQRIEADPRHWASLPCGKIAESRLADYPGMEILLPPGPATPQSGASRDVLFILAAMKPAQARKAIYIHLGSSGSVTACHNGEYYHHPFRGGDLLERSIPKAPRGFFNSLIHRVGLDTQGQVSFDTFNEGAPLGLLGSALLGLAADLLRHGCIDEHGAFTRANLPHVATERYIVAPKHKTAGYNPISIHSDDLKEIMAIRSSCASAVAQALDTVGMAPEEVERVYVSGPFGVSADMGDLDLLGFFPSSMAGRALFIRNAAGLGARMALLSASARHRADSIAQSLSPLAPAAETDRENTEPDNRLEA